MRGSDGTTTAVTPHSASLAPCHLGKTCPACLRVGQGASRGGEVVCVLLRWTELTAIGDLDSDGAEDLDDEQVPAVGGGARGNSGVCEEFEEAFL